MNAETISLSHLVEAATALTKLVDGDKDKSRKIPTVEAPVCEPRTVSGDEDVERKPRLCGFPREIFPQRLFQMLADSSVSDAISWLPHGRSFVVIRPDVFSERVLPLYFHSRASTTKYPSFTRKLNRWGFRQVTGGPDTGAFQHPLFRRDQPHQCLDMECEKRPRKRYPSAAGKIKTTAPSMMLHISPMRCPSAAGNSETTKALSSVAKSTPSLPLFTPPASTTQHAVLTSETFAAVKRDSKPSQHFLNETISFTSTPSTRRTSLSPVIPSSPGVPTDPSLVAATLRASEQQEQLAVAKSMLYEAYLSALKALETCATSK